jgi:hypothetical protein
MLGALDAAWEAENDAPITPVAFARVELVGGVKDFATKPFDEAIADFSSRAVVTRRTFDRLDVAARRRAFTVAGLTRGGMLETAHGRAYEGARGRFRSSDVLEALARALR